MLSPPSLSRDSSTPLPHRVLGRWIHEHFWGKEAEECLIDRRHNENPKCFGHLEHLTIVTRWGKQGKSSAAAAASLRAQGGRDLRRDSYTDSILWAKVLPKYADTFSFIKEAPGWLTGAEKSSPILSGTPRGHDVRSKGVGQCSLTHLRDREWEQPTDLGQGWQSQPSTHQFSGNSCSSEHGSAPSSPNWDWSWDREEKWASESPYE